MARKERKRQVWAIANLSAASVAFPGYPEQTRARVIQDFVHGWQGRFRRYRDWEHAQREGWYCLRATLEWSPPQRRS